MKRFTSRTLEVGGSTGETLQISVKLDASWVTARFRGLNEEVGIGKGNDTDLGVTLPR